MAAIRNVPLARFRKFLEAQGLKIIKDTKGHEKWARKDLLRPVVIQSHIDPVPLHVIKSNLKTLSITLQDFSKWLENN